MSRWLKDEVKNPYMRDWKKTEAGKAYAERHKAYAKAWRERNKEKFHAKQKENYDNVRLEALIHYSKDPPICACPDCGVTELEFLTLDHIKGDGAEHRREIGQAQGTQDKAGRKLQEEKTGKKITIGGNGLPYFLKKNGWPKGFQVLCMNCNFAKKRKKFCPIHNKVRTAKA